MSRTQIFRDRLDAGEQLAKLVRVAILEAQSEGMTASPIVYALPRGGIPVAAVVARELGCPLDVIVAKKITAPKNQELAIGAITTDGYLIWANSKLLNRKSPSMLEKAVHRARSKAAAQWSVFAPYCRQVSPEGRLAILVDDGIATGMTMAAALGAMRKRSAARVWIAAPVAPRDFLNGLPEWGTAQSPDGVIIVETPHPFLSVSRFYVKFPQISTQEALTQLQQYNRGKSEVGRDKACLVSTEVGSVEC